MHYRHKKFLDNILSNIEPKSGETVNIYDSLGRVLHSDIAANRSFPNNDTVSIDGYAIICENTHSAPINLQIIGESTAGDPFEGEILNGEAVRTYAGCPLPKGADTVISDDKCKVKGKTLSIKKPFLNNQNILYCGVDFVKDEPVLKKGHTITPIYIALAVAMHHASLQVNKTVNIGILEVGDELAKLGENKDITKTTSTTGIILQSFIRSSGAMATDLGIISDNEEAIMERLKEISGVDLIVTTGGLSNASKSLMKKAINKYNSSTYTLKLNLNITASVMFSIIDNMPVLSLSGQPIAAYMSATLFLKPIIHHFNNAIGNATLEQSALLDRDLDVNDLEMDYICSRLVTNEHNILKAMPASSYDKMLMSALLYSDCIIKVDKNHSKKENPVNIIKFYD